MAKLKKEKNSFELKLEKAAESQKIFEEYCKKRNIDCAPFGTDDRRARLSNYLDIHPFLRKLCDYVISTPEEIIFTDVKATRNIKFEDIAHYSIFESLFCVKNQTFVLTIYIDEKFYFTTLEEVLKCSVGKEIKAYYDGSKTKPYFELSDEDLQKFYKEIHLYW